jgi:hypothetical protein
MLATVANPYEIGLDKNAANYVPLTPISFLLRSAAIEMMSAGAAPPAAVIEGMEGLGFHITHVYGPTEVYGPSVACAWHGEWDEWSRAEQARLKARQDVAYPVLDDLMVAGGVNPAASERAQKSRERQRTSRLCKGPGCRGLRSVPLELEDLVLDAELLALQIRDRIPIRQGTPILLIDGAL